MIDAGRKCLVFVFVVAGHIAALAVFVSIRPNEDSRSERSISTLVFIESEPNRRKRFPEQGRPSEEQLPKVEEAVPSRVPLAISPIDEERDRPIDWTAERQRAAESAATDSTSQHRQFGRDINRNPPKPAGSAFPWDKTHTQRFDKLPDGSFLIRLNERCQLVLAPIPLVGCRLGKVKPRGDLFEQMNKPAEFGDWKDGDLP